MTESEMVARARSAIGLHVTYKLGAGGRDPRTPSPASASGLCDCTGFLAWCLGVDRKLNNPWYQQFNGGWLQSEAIFRDCATPFGMFDGIVWKESRPGMVLVFGNRTDSEGKRHVGHVGVVSAVDDKGPAQVVHCSAGNFRATRDAIQETDVLIFKTHGAQVARCALVDP